jgi:hypothetical protein
VIFGAGGGIVSFLKATKKLPLKKMRDSEWLSINNFLDFSPHQGQNLIQMDEALSIG